MGKNRKSKNIRCVAIAGPSASGKSMLAKKLSKVFGRNSCLVLCQDDYYKDWSKSSFSKRSKINFDHPASFDFRLLEKHLRALKKGIKIKAPVYSFKKHMRLAKRYTLYAKRYIIVEGLMPLLKRELRSLSDCKVYVDIDNSISLSRRLKRDITERAETIESVCRRYFNEVLPMQKKYVETQKRWADVVIDGRKRIGRETISRIIKKIDCGCR